MPRTSAKPDEGGCPVCSSARLEPLPFAYEHRGSLLQGTRCRACEVVFLDPMPTDEEIAALYGEEYFTTSGDTGGAHGRGAYLELAEEAELVRYVAARAFDSVFRGHLRRRGELLDVGCGPGFFLKAMRDLGWKVAGLEISAYAAQLARERHDLDVTTGSISTARFQADRFDAVIMGDVLEHLPRPVEALETVRTWMKPDGLLFVAIPSTLNLLSTRIGLAIYRLLGRRKKLRIPPYHLFEYTPASIRRTLGVSGFEVLS
ncbi:MAG: methyltransferase domain-containing protein, partial [Candidatus Latescibacteria bacterium]|nr:methyltransferase domain-containing protein [Candidatus Latescibacterota bacterium]